MKRSGWWETCPCGEKFWVQPHRLKSGRGKRCSRACMYRFRYMGRPPPLVVGRLTFIPLTQAGLWAVVDTADLDLVEGRSWSVSRSGHTWYVRSKRSGGQLHRAILGLADDDPRQGDHINGNGLDNRRANLRPASRAQNMANRRPNVSAASKYKGVRKSERGSGWAAMLSGGYLGYFPTEEAAARAYDAAAAERYGQYARLNFPKVDA